MSAEKFMGWIKHQIECLNLFRVLSYWFGWLACCTFGAMMVNLWLPVPLRWYTDQNQWLGAFFFGVLMIVLCSGAYVISRDID